MAVRVAPARSTEELDELFVVRHEVFCGGGYMPPQPNGRIIDRFDAFPGTVNVVAKVDGRVVGGMRLDPPSVCGTGADELYDFTGQIPEPESTGGVSRICLLPKYRRQLGVHKTLWKMLVYIAALKGLTYLRGSANPERTNLYEALGWRTIGEQVRDAEAGLDVVPMMLEVAKASASLRGFIDHQQLFGFEDVFERAFYAAGERVFCLGDAGDEVYLIIEGIAHVELPTRQVRLGEGELFGELALLTDRPRTASVEAVTDLEVMTLSRSQLRDQLATHPEQAIRLLESVAGRLVDGIMIDGSAGYRD